jgi:hypothetical protein
VATSVPPHTDEQKRHHETASHPGSAHAAFQATVMATSAWRLGSPSGLSASPPSSTAKAAKDRASAEARRPKLRSHPRVVLWGDTEAIRHRADPDLTRGDRLESVTDGLDRVETVPRHERREQGMGAPTRRARAPRDPDLVNATLVAHETRVARPEHHRTQTRRAMGPRDLDFSTSRRVGVDGQRAGPYDGHRWKHRLGPLPRC